MQSWQNIKKLLNRCLLIHYVNVYKTESEVILGFQNKKKESCQMKQEAHQNEHIFTAFYDKYLI